MVDEALIEPSLPRAELQRLARATGQRFWLAVLGAFVVGMAAAGWVGWLGGADFGRLIGRPAVSSPAIVASQPGFAPSPPSASRDEMALTGRVAAMEQRLDRVDLRVEAASGNAARAEALLVAFAVRRVVERGAPLGTLADQLKLRFGEAQPHAVATIIGGAKDLVPLDQLAARLELLAPQLTDTSQQNLWGRITRTLSDLFVVRRDRPLRSDTEVRFDDARKALSEGRIDEAVADVQRLSNGADAASWSAAARHTRDVEAALDLIDTTALLAPQQLRDGGGNTLSPAVQ